MAKSKKTTPKKAEPKPKKEEVKAVEVAAQPEPQTVEKPKNETPDNANTHVGEDKSVLVEVLPDLAEVEETKAEADAELQEGDFVLDADAQLNYKSVIGCSKIWANDLLAAKNKYFERYFFLEKNANVEIGAKVFTDEGLSVPFIGMDYWITLSTTEGEHNPNWAACKVDNNGVIVSVIYL